MSQLAFPTAVGAGAYTTGGRGGKVCHVDTLTWDTSVVYDSATDSYSGGFYNMFYELDIPAKEIVFTVSGTIDVPSYTVLDFSTKTNKGNITVSGQTSNIVFSTDYFQIENISNLIWRYTSFYKRNDQSAGADVLWISSSTGNVSENIIFDHCSAFYGGDECFSIASSSGQGEMNNVTVQWCMMGASSKGSIIGAYTGQSNATTAYCSYQDISFRFPNMLGYGSDSQQDAYNIFVGNYTSRLIRVTGDANFNVQNMYVQANKDDYGRHRMQYQSTAPCQLYAGGTIITGVQDTPAYPEFDDVWSTFSGSSVPEYDPIPSDARASSAFPLVGEAGTIYDTADIKTEVLPYTGNTKRLDNDGSIIEDEYALDAFYRDLGINKQATTIQTRYPATQYPQPNSATALTSTLKDGIPDTWRSANMNGESHDDIVAGTHYTWLETFHNQVDEGSVVNRPIITRTDNNPTTIAFGGTYVPPTGTWTDVEDGSGTATVGGDIVSTSIAGDYNVTLSHTDTDGNTGSLTIIYTVQEQGAPPQPPNNDNNMNTINWGQIYYTSYFGSGRINNIAWGIIYPNLEIDNTIDVTSVEVTPSTSTITEGDTVQLSVNILPVDATDQTGVWSSSNEAIATVDSDGLVTSITDGSVTITFTSNDGGFTDTCDITVDALIQNLFVGNAGADASGEVNSTTGFSTLGNTSVAVNSTDQLFGSHCIELENGTAGGGFDRVEYDITVENGAQYDVSLWARELVGSDGRIQLWSGVSGWSTVVLTSTWTEYTATVTATSTTMKMRFYPNNGSGSAGDKILLDNISVTKV